MNSPTSPDRAKASPDWSYSKFWRVFIVAILRVLLRLVMRYEWQGRENFPKTGGVILAPNHLSYADWGTIALFSDAYGHRFPVFMIKASIFRSVAASTSRGAALQRQACVLHRQSRGSVHAL